MKVKYPQWEVDEDSIEIHTENGSIRLYCKSESDIKVLLLALKTCVKVETEEIDVVARVGSFRLG